MAAPAYWNKKNRLDFFKQVVEQTDDHEQHDDKPDDRDPVGHILFTHLLQHSMNHRDNDADAGDLKYRINVHVHVRHLILEPIPSLAKSELVHQYDDERPHQQAETLPHPLVSLLFVFGQLLFSAQLVDGQTQMLHLIVPVG